MKKRGQAESGSRASGGDLAPPARPFQEALSQWFLDEGKDYPWRRTTDPYAILVSEVMLQQTQIATVLGRGFYDRWLARFPDVESLAVASEEEVLRLWEGLGYYSRARNLQKTARAIVEQYGGAFPGTAAEILALPGVGRYTAGAVSSFAYDLPEAVVDANVARVLARVCNYRGEVDSTAGLRQLWAWAEALVPAGGGRIHNSALMELGQRICTPKNPGCSSCPVAAHCSADDPSLLPVKKPRKKTVNREERVILAVKGGKVLLEQEKARRRNGLWKLPERTVEELGDAAEIYRSVYGITHFRVNLFVYQKDDAHPVEGEVWHPIGQVATLPMPSPFRKALDALFNREDLPLFAGSKNQF